MGCNFKKLQIEGNHCQNEKTNGLEKIFINDVSDKGLNIQNIKIAHTA